MVQFLSINFFLGFLQFLLGFSKVPVFLCQPVPLLKGSCLQQEKFRSLSIKFQADINVYISV